MFIIVTAKKIFMDVSYVSRWYLCGHRFFSKFLDTGGTYVTKTS